LSSRPERSAEPGPSFARPAWVPDISAARKFRDDRDRYPPAPPPRFPRRTQWDRGTHLSRLPPMTRRTDPSWTPRASRGELWGSRWGF